jgi:hypothetical protein
MASVSEVWGTDFGKRAPKPLSSKQSIPETRDPVKEGRVASSPQERSAIAIRANRKTIDDLSHTLSIVQTDDEAGRNYAPVPVPREVFHEHFSPQPVWGQERPTDNPSHDMLLYIFTGLVFLFTLDTFVSLGKRMR